MSNALIAAADLGMDCVQVFTKNQRQWNAKPLQEKEIESWLNELQNNGWDGNGKTVSHNSYLINLASPDEEARK